MADYTQVYINNDMAKLNTVLQTLVTNGIVGAVDYDSSGTYAVFTFYADAEKTTEVFRITQAQGYSAPDFYKYTFTATASDGTTLTSTGTITTASATAQIRGYIFMYGYACANGVMLGLNSVNGNAVNIPIMWLMITKNQNDVPVFVWTNNASTSVDASQILTAMNTEYIVASSDVAPLTTVPRLAPVQKNQVVLSPFFSCSDVGEVSYTPETGRIIAGNKNQLIYDTIAHEITFDGATWLTNGYWALKVRGTT